MTDTVDLLPAAYRQRTARRRARRDLFLLAIPVLLALIGTDLLLRMRVDGVRRMAMHAHRAAEDGETLAALSKRLTQNATDLQTRIDQASMPLRGTRMSELLDDLIAERPAGVRLLEVSCRHDPWRAGDTPVIALRASCAVAAEFTDYLTALRHSETLPPMRCERSDIRAGSTEFTFQLETDLRAASEATGGRR